MTVLSKCEDDMTDFTFLAVTAAIWVTFVWLTLAILIVGWMDE